MRGIALLIEGVAYGLPRVQREGQKPRNEAYRVCALPWHEQERLYQVVNG